MIPLNHSWWRGWVVVYALVPGLSHAGLTVIYDSGQSLPIAPFLEIFEAADEGPQQSPATKKPQLGAADPETWLPIRSPGLTPGPVRGRKHERPFARPFFLIGSDPLSRQWLKVHRERLKKIGAVGMLVQADGVEDLHSIARLADGLAILPASASDIARALGVSHYPVLISAHGITQ